MSRPFLAMPRWLISLPRAMWLLVYRLAAHVAVNRERDPFVTCLIVTCTYKSHLISFIAVLLTRHTNYVYLLYFSLFALRSPLSFLFPLCYIHVLVCTIRVYGSLTDYGGASIVVFALKPTPRMSKCLLCGRSHHPLPDIDALFRLDVTCRIQDYKLYLLMMRRYS